MDAVTLILFVIGLVILVLGASLLVRGASALATTLGISPMVIGLTVVSLGTSAPELAVVIQSNLTGEAGVGVGNVVGSNIFNVLVVLGLSAVIAPLLVSPGLLKLDGPVMVGAGILLLLLALDRELNRLDGLLLVLILITYTIYLIRRDRSKEPAEDVAVAAPGPWPLQLGRLLAGLGLLVLGSHWLVNGAVDMAETLGLSPIIVGLTVVAIGTSLPEVATSIQAALQGERDIAVGNVVGSNIFNVLAVLGLAALVSPTSIPVPDSAMTFDVPVVIGVTIAGLLSFATGYRITRLEGALFLGYYVMYTVYLILEATDHPAFGWFRLLAFVLAAAGLVFLVGHVIMFAKSQARSSA